MALTLASSLFSCFYESVVTNLLHFPGEAKTFTRLVCYEIKSILPIFKTEMLVCQLKVDLCPINTVS